MILKKRMMFLAILEKRMERKFALNLS